MEDEEFVEIAQNTLEDELLKEYPDPKLLTLLNRVRVITIIKDKHE
jgi:hypothetical protein